MHTSPALLVSYVYLKDFRKVRPDIQFRDWSLDSGAFSVKAGTGAVSIEQYTDECRELLATDPQLVEVFALDVIGDWKQSARNAEWMWEQGVPAIPCFHAGEPEEALIAMAARFPKIALGGMVGYVGPKKIKWIEQCFGRVWPKKIHGFGIAGKNAVLAVPWHSTDATNWEAGPTRFGNWHRYGGLSVRGSTQQLRHEVEHYLRLESLAQHKFAAQMRELDASDMTLRLALAAGGGGTKKRTEMALRLGGIGSHNSPRATEALAAGDPKPTEMALRLALSIKGEGGLAEVTRLALPKNDLALRLSIGGPQNAVRNGLKAVNR